MHADSTRTKSDADSSNNRAHIVVLLCGGTTDELIDAPVNSLLQNSGAQVYIHEVSALPTRPELKIIDAVARDILPVDPTPSLEEIAKQPDVGHLGSPQPAPQNPSKRFRIIVVGDDAALSAVMTRMMRGDYMWAELAFVPSHPAGSAAARNWGLPTAVSHPLASGSQELWQLAINAPALPTPTIRNDAGIAVAGSALITDWDDAHFFGEIIIDDNVLVRGDSTYGARLVPMLDAPGIAAVTMLPQRISLLRKLTTFAKRKNRSVETPAMQLDPDSLLTGRAVQAGGQSIGVIVDGIKAKRPVDRVTFYRHLRDLQAVRPA